MTSRRVLPRTETVGRRSWAAPASTSPELSGRPRRRTFTARDKLRILAATDRAAETGGIGAILRREGIYSSTLCDWRRQRDAGTFGALTPVKRGPKTAEPNPLAAENASLRKNNDHFARCLARAEAIIAVQKTCRPAGRASTRARDRDDAGRRRALTVAVLAMPPINGMTAAVCAALGISRATVERRRSRLARCRRLRTPDRDRRVP
jgi:transposase